MNNIYFHLHVQYTQKLLYTLMGLVIKSPHLLLAQIFCILSVILAINRKHIPTRNLKNVLLMEAQRVPTDV